MIDVIINIVDINLTKFYEYVLKNIKFKQAFESISI